MSLNDLMVSFVGVRFSSGQTMLWVDLYCCTKVILFFANGVDKPVICKCYFW